MTHKKLTLSALAISAMGLAACAGNQAVPRSYVDTPLLDRHNVDVAAKTETLEIPLDQQATQLTIVDKRRIKAFVRAYEDHGHGPLVMLLPEATPNQQFAVSAVAEARAIAFENGVSYEEISGGAKYGPVPSLVLSFTAYEALKPECQTFATVDFAATRTNSDLPNLGCAVRTNMAAMIADPGDLLGNRPLDGSDTVRRQTTLELYRGGEQTASERNDRESGTVSDAVNDQ